MNPTVRSKTASPFTGLGVGLMIGIGCLALLAAVGVAGVTANLRGGSVDGGHALSRSAIGFAGLVRLLDEADVPAGLNRFDLKSGPPTQGLLILTPELGPKPWSLKGLHHQGPVLVILPKWSVMPDPKHPGWVYNVGLVDQESLTRAVSQLASGIKKAEGEPAEVNLSRTDGVQHPVLGAGQGLFSAGTRLDYGPVAMLQTLRVSGWTPALVDGQGRALLVQAPDQPIYVLGDPDLLNNHGLVTLPAARSAVALIGALRGDRRPVMFDVTLNGFSRPRSLLSTFLRPPLLPATLCALAAALLMAWQAVARFGPTRPAGRAIALGKTALLETSTAVIHRARAAPRMAPRYAVLTRALAAKAVGAPSGLSTDDTDALLDRLSATEPGQAPFTVLAAKAAKATTLLELLAASRALFEWRMTVAHDSR